MASARSYSCPVVKLTHGIWLDNHNNHRIPYSRAPGRIALETLSLVLLGMIARTLGARLDSFTSGRPNYSLGCRLLAANQYSKADCNQRWPVPRFRWHNRSWYILPLSSRLLEMEHLFRCSHYTPPSIAGHALPIIIEQRTIASGPVDIPPFVHCDRSVSRMIRFRRASLPSSNCRING